MTTVPEFIRIALAYAPPIEQLDVTSLRDISLVPTGSREFADLRMTSWVTIEEPTALLVFTTVAGIDDLGSVSLSSGGRVELAWDLAERLDLLPRPLLADLVDGGFTGQVRASAITVLSLLYVEVESAPQWDSIFERSLRRGAGDRELVVRYQTAKAALFTNPRRGAALLREMLARESDPDCREELETLSAKFDNDDETGSLLADVVEVPRVDRIAYPFVCRALQPTLSCLAEELSCGEIETRDGIMLATVSAPGEADAQMRLVVDEAAGVGCAFVRGKDRAELALAASKCLSMIPLDIALYVATHGTRPEARRAALCALGLASATTEDAELGAALYAGTESSDRLERESALHALRLGAAARMELDASRS